MKKEAFAVDLDAEEDDEDEDEDDLEEEARLAETEAKESVRRQVKPPANVPPLIRTDVNKRIDSLEDLYANYPDLGDSSSGFFVRLYRDYPKQFFGQNIMGRIADFPDAIAYDQILQQYGGGAYRVAVMGPGPGRPNNNGERPIRQHRAFQVRIPGPPIPHIPVDGFAALPAANAAQAPEREPEMTVQVPPMMPPMMPAMGQQSTGQAPPQVQLERMKIDERKELRVEEKQETMQRFAQEAQNASLRQLTEVAEKHADHLRRQLDQMGAVLAEKDRHIAKLTETQAKVQASEILATRIAEESKGGRERAEMELARLKEEQRMRYDEVDRRHRDMLEETRRRFDDDKSRIERESAAERDRLREDARVREQSLKDDADRRIASQRDQYEGRINDVIRTTEREIVSIKEQRDREIRSLEIQTKSEIGSSKSGFETRVALLESERVRLMTDLDRMTKKYEDLHRSSQKDPVTFINETRDIAMNVLGMIPASEARGGGEEEGELSWQKVVAKGLMGFAEKAPEMLQQVGQMRAQGAAMVQQRNALAARANGAPGPHGPGLPPPQSPRLGPSQRASRGIVAPMRPVDPNSMQAQMPAPNQGPPGPIQNIIDPHMGPVMQGQGMQGPPNFEDRQPQFGPPPQNYGPPQNYAPSPSQPPQGFVPQSHDPTSHLASRPSAFPPSLEGASQEQLQQYLSEFVGQLNEAIQSDGMVSAKLFTKMVIEKAGAQAVTQFLTMIPSPEPLFEQLEKQGADVAITTRDGRKYTKEVWTEARSILGLDLQRS